MFSRSLGVKNIRPKVLYLRQASAGQWHWHTICTTPYRPSLHSWQSCRPVSPNLNRRALRTVRTVTGPTAALSLCLLTAGSFSFPLDRRSLTGHNPDTSSTCSGASASNDSRWFLCPQQNGCRQFGQRRHSVSPFVGQFISFFISRHSVIPVYSTICTSQQKLSRQSDQEECDSWDMQHAFSRGKVNVRFW